MKKVRTGFKKDLTKIFANGTNLLQYPDIVNNLTSRLDSICSVFGIETRHAVIDGAVLNIPTEFVTSLNAKRREGQAVSFFT